MSDLRVHVHIPDGARHRIDAPPNMTALDFVKELVEGLKLPRTRPDGREIHWFLDDKDTARTLDSDKTLQENGVLDGHHLYLRESLPVPQPPPEKNVEPSPVPSPDDKFVPPETFWERWKVRLAFALVFLTLGVGGYLVYEHLAPGPAPRNSAQKVPVTVSLSPSTADLAAGQEQRFAGTVTGSSNKAVNWALNPEAGRISQDGVYSAPSQILSSQTVMVIARSEADPTKVATAMVTLKSPPRILLSVSVNPGTALLAARGTQRFTVTVTGSTNTNVTWSVSPEAGSISKDGVYTAPDSIPSPEHVTVTARSEADPMKFGTAIVTLRPPTPPRQQVSISLSPSHASLTASGRQAFVVAVTDSSNKGISWSISPEVGSITDGVYEAPHSISFPQNVTVRATSRADPAKSANATVMLKPPNEPVVPVTVSVGPPVASLAASRQQVFMATVNGSNNRSVIWSIDPPGLGNISPNGVYSAPASVKTPTTVIIRATSEADPRTSSTARIILEPPPSPPVRQNPPPPVRQNPPIYSGPSSGTILWSGDLEKNGTVEIDGDTASGGSLQGALPGGVPVMIDIDTKEFAIAVAPSPDNDWKRVVIRSKRRRHSVIEIRWTVTQ